MARLEVPRRTVAPITSPSIRRLPWTRWDTIAVTSVTAVAGLLRLVRATTPHSLVFDEHYYAISACEFVFGNGPPCHRPGLLSVAPVHPPLGEWLIAFGIRIFGFRSGGWRMASLVAGTLTVALLFLLARRLLRSTPAATIVSGLLAIDFLHFVHSRLAMLDIFVSFFVVAAFLFAIYDRDSDRAIGWIGERPGWRQRVLARRWRVAAGVALGCAVASKWSGVPYLMVVPVLIFVWEAQQRAGSNRREHWFGTIRHEGPSLAACFLILPLIVYVLSYAGRLHGAIFALPWARGSWVREFLAAQRAMLDFHLSLNQMHIYASAPWSWPFLKRPVVYSFDPHGTQYATVMALGNPLVWWSALAAFGYLAVRWLRGHRGGGEALILAGFAAGWLPWFVFGPFRETMFLYYLLPSVPFMCLALGYVIARVIHRPVGRILVTSFVAASVGLFVFFYPVIAGIRESEHAWHERMLFTDCDLNGVTFSGVVSKLRLPPNVTPPTDVPGPYPEALLRTQRPDGWCWI